MAPSGKMTHPIYTIYLVLPPNVILLTKWWKIVSLHVTENNRKSDNSSLRSNLSRILFCEVFLQSSIDHPDLYINVKVTHNHNVKGKSVIDCENILDRVSCFFYMYCFRVKMVHFCEVKMTCEPLCPTTVYHFALKLI